jgi:hypothetical protein
VWRDGRAGSGGRNYAVRLSTVDGEPVIGAEVWLIGQDSDGIDFQTRLTPASALGVYRGLVPTMAEGPAQFSVRVVVRARQFLVAVTR